MLADIRRGDEDLGEGHGVVGQEVDAEEVLRIGVDVDDTRDVDDEPDGQLRDVVCDVLGQFQVRENAVRGTDIPEQPCRQRRQPSG